MVPHYSVHLRERALIGCSKAACLFSASDTVAGTVSKSATQRHSYLSLHIYIMPVYGVTSTTCFFLPCASQCRFERCVLEDMPDPSMDASGSQSRANVLTPGIIGLLVQGIETGMVFSQLAIWLSLPRRSQHRLITVLTLFITIVGLCALSFTLS